MYINIIYILIVMNNQQIEQIYKQFNRPGPAKLLKLVKEAGIQVNLTKSTYVPKSRISWISTQGNWLPTDSKTNQSYPQN